MEVLQVIRKVVITYLKFSHLNLDLAFKHTTSRQQLLQSNGFVEAAVKSINKTLQKSYTATPTRRHLRTYSFTSSTTFRTSVLVIPSQLKSEISNRLLQNQARIFDWFFEAQVKFIKINLKKTNDGYSDKDLVQSTNCSAHSERPINRLV